MVNTILLATTLLGCYAGWLMLAGAELEALAEQRCYYADRRKIYQALLKGQTVWLTTRATTSGQLLQMTELAHEPDLVDVHYLRSRAGKVQTVHRLATEEMTLVLPSKTD
jgi:hypothetical protein